jgi:general secretion pathway protein G
LRTIIGHKGKIVTFAVILILIVILGLLTMFNVFDVTGRLDNKREQEDINKREQAIEMIENLENAFSIYYLQNRFYPTTEQGFEALVTKPTTDPSPRKYPERGYLEKVPVDPWGNPFIYRCHGEKGPIYIISLGPDGIETTKNYITNYKNEEIPSLQEILTYIPPKPEIVPDVTDDFPKAALPALDSLMKIRKGFFSSRGIYDPAAKLGMRVRDLPYVYYNNLSETNLTKDSDDRIARKEKESIGTSDRKYDPDTIIREIISEENIDFNRRMAFVSYGNLNWFVPTFTQLKKPISFEYFLTSVFLSLSDIRIGIPESVYLSFVEEVLIPISHDLAQKGPARPPIVINDAFIERLSRYVHQDRSKLPKSSILTKYLVDSFTFPEPIPPEILWSGIYRKIDRLIAAGYYKDPYYLYKYYKTLPSEGDDVIEWGEALDVDIWCNYYINILKMNHFEEKIEEIKNLMLVLRR